jgi:flagellar biosynthetic protein FliP
MLQQTRDSDLALFTTIAGRDDIDSADAAPLSMIVPSFMVSELKTAFQIGFLIFIPFLVIDLVVASVLMSMGMMMLSPMLISLPFKIMLFVLVDGWALVLGTLASSFYT